ncbi:RagB/SusD family nutrient uptake outer membrane protein [Fulvivirgaceae bacterium BMA10]|uniref:RagB/SusD family nutrient uptake outer membrane protein n=1 Tax=Splendidivirga corallicola TaxID=3051826 RepID=A0ABT8KU68_9BACT|nr:RagB/SusD family nutrient uptake outer membrane protein [Fulvivirgaceae bacterium BMA10]
MKKILYIYLISGIVFTSCDDFLDVEPETATTPEIALDTETDIVSALHGAYSILNDDGYAMEYNVIGSVATDDGKIPSDREAAGAARDRIPHAYTLDLNEQTTTVELWLDAYQVIAGVNNIMARLDAVEFEQSFEDRIKAECLSLRALMHFSLTQIFAQDYNFTGDQSHLAVPYMTVTDPGSAPARNTMAEVYTALFADINEALSLFTSAGDDALSAYRGGSSIYFMSYDAALGLRAKMSFYRTDYASALADADELLAAGYTLEPTYTTGTYDNDGEVGTFVDQWYSLAPVLESEAIFQLDVDSDDGSFANRSLIDIYTANNGNAAHAVSDDLIDLYEPGDARLAWYHDENATLAPDLHVFKYPGGLGINADAHHFPVMRLTEFQLMAAEIQARNGNDGVAQALLLPITNRAGASPITSSGNDLVEDIITERRKELAFEGSRLYDLKRLQRGFVRNDCLLTNGNCIVDYPTNLYAWPIPVAELNGNDNLVQNTGF